MRRFLWTLAPTLGALVAALVTINAAGYRLGLVEVANQQIYQYQRGKIDAAGAAPIDVAFVGDSSLGNAIDAALFASVSGRATVNLALTGAYGSGGAYNMAYQMLMRHDPKLIVVMQSIDVMRRADAFPGFYFSAEPSQLLTTSPVRILELYFSLKTARRIVEQLWKAGVARPADLVANDYIPQAHDHAGFSPAAQVAAHPLLPKLIAPGQLEYLQRIAQLCRARGTACIYAHGPIYDGYCRTAAEYREQLDAAIMATGLPIVAGTPVCIPADELGDTVDHVRPDLKQAFTRHYLQLLRPYLEANGAASVQRD